MTDFHALIVADMPAPAGMVEVTKEQFFAHIGPQDVTPRPERDKSVWETRYRAVVGVSFPGYMGARLPYESRYFLTSARAEG